MLKRLVLLSLSLIIAISLSACGKKSPAPAAPPVASATEPTSSAAIDTAMVAQSVYKQNCVSCHGVDLAGGVGPSLQKVGARLTQQQIATTITNGRGGMPSFKDKLKPEEIDALANWLYSKK
jgi:cytochrome c551